MLGGYVMIQLPNSKLWHTLFSILIIPGVIVVLAGCSSQYPTSGVSQNQTSQQSGKNLTGNQASGDFSRAFAGISDSQRRLNFISTINLEIKGELEAFYRQYNRMPLSYNELLESGWHLLTPIPQYYAPGIKITDQITAPGLNPDALQLQLFIYGYNLIAFMPWGSDNGNEEYQSWELGNADLVYALNDQYQELEDEVWSDSNPENVRIMLLFQICDALLVDYWTDKLELPSTSEELLNGKWDLDDSPVIQFPLIDENSSGFFYLGITPDLTVEYMEFKLNNRGPVVTQKIFNQEEIFSTGVMGRPVCSDESVKRDDTIPIIDSRLPNWGFNIN
jgi:hypothetical protein